MKADDSPWQVKGERFNATCVKSEYFDFLSSKNDKITEKLQKNKLFFCLAILVDS